MANSIEIIDQLLENTQEYAQEQQECIYSKKRAIALKNKELCQKMMAASIDWAISNGLVMGSPNIDNAYIHAPFTLLPVLQNLNEFKELSSISLIFHKLIDAVSRDSDFLISCIESTAESDPEFTGKMLALYKKQISEKQMTQKYQLGIFRSDYMKNALTNKWGQIEMNTISASFGALSDSVYNLHKFLLNRYLNISHFQTPQNNTSKNIAFALAAAANLVHPNGGGIVLMLVQNGETNSSDQRRIEYDLWNDHKIRTLRRSMLEVFENGKLDKDTKELIVDDEYKISVVYYRSGYTPNDYKSGDKEWRARELMECSTAIKCPSIGYHLIGSKAFQTIFSQRKVLTKYLTESEADKLMSVFVGLYSLNDCSDELIADASKNCEKYVLKPQREGGGNNYYNEDIPKMFEKMSEMEWGGYILMERIYPKEIETVQIRNFQMNVVKAICEMGIYSAYLSDGNGKAMIDEVCGSLLRTKQAQVTEGGVATGYAVLDSIVFSE